MDGPLARNRIHREMVYPESQFHNGNRVFLNLPEPDGERQGNDENPPSAIPVAGRTNTEG